MTRVQAVRAAALALLATAVVHAAPPSAPVGLRAVSATRAEVKLAWDAADGASSYAVETAGPNGQWTTLKEGAEPAATFSVEPFSTYKLRVRARAADGVPSPPSNEITVGPPPTGFHLVAPVLTELTDAARFAPKLVMALDDNGDPAFAFLVVDLNNDEDLSDTELRTVTWNRASYRWNAPVTVDRVGAVNMNGALVGFALASDAGAHRLGLAYMAGEKDLRLAWSDDHGATWKSQTVQQDPVNTFASPSLALANGRLYLAYFHGDEGIRYRTGAQADAPGKWTSELAPKPAGASGDVRAAGITVALDGAGKPALACLVGPDETSNLVAAFWRPGSPAVRAADSNGQSTDDPDLRLTFQGTQPRLIFYMKRDDKFFNAADQIWVARAKDDGASWDAPVALPNDGGNTMNSPIALSISSKGAAAATAWVDGGNNSGTRCGQPKLIQSTDFTRWTICAPGGTAGSPAKDVYTPQLTFADNDKLYIGYVSRLGAAIGKGILLWREP